MTNTDKVFYCAHLLHDLAEGYPKTMQAFHHVELDFDFDGGIRITFWCSRWRYQELDITNNDINAMMFQQFDMTWELDDTGLMRGDGDFDGIKIRCFLIDEL